MKLSPFISKFQAAIACLSLFAAASQLRAVSLDFTTLPSGNVTTIGDVTFSLAGAGESGAPSIDHSYGGGLWNSTDGASYPTNTILRADFAAPVSNVTWDYDAQGLNGDPLQGWTVYDSSLSVLASGTFTSSLSFYDLSAYSGISRIEWHNGRNDWLSNLNTLSYNASVPDFGSTLALLGIGLIGMVLGVAGRRRKA